MSERNGNTETPKHRYTVLGLLTVSMVVAFWFSPWWIGGRVLAPLDVLNEMMQPWRATSESPEVKNHMVSDSVTQYLGYRMFAENQLRSEGRIGWSDLTYGGTPTYANTMALFDDWTMQLHRWFGFWTAWHVGLIGQALLAAVGMFFFLRGRTIGVVLAMAGGLAWAANSQFVCWVNHRWALSCFCWLPWIFLSMDRYRVGQRYWALIVPVFMALGFLGGTLQHAGLLVLAVVAYWLSEERGWSWGERLKGLSRHGLWGLGGVGLAAFMFLPQIEAFRISSALELHTGMFQGLEQGWYPEGVMQPLFNLAAYPLQIFPSLLGACDSVDVLKLFKSELFYVAYFGSLPVIMAFLGVFRKDTPSLARWLIVLGLLLPLTPLVRLLYQRLYLLFIFGGIFAFAHHIQHAAPEQRRKVCRWISAVGLVLVVGWLGVSVFLSTMGEAWLQKVGEVVRERGAGSTFGHFDGWIETRGERFISRLMIWSPWQLLPLGLFALGVVGYRMTAAAMASKRQLGLLMIAFSVMAEVTVFAQRWVTWSDPVKHPLYAETLEIKALKGLLNDGRVKNLTDPVTHMPRTPMMPNTLVPYGVPTIGGYDSIVPDGMVLPGDREINSVVLARQGISHLTVPVHLPVTAPGWSEVWSSDSTRIYQNENQVARYLGFMRREELEAYVDGSTEGRGIPLAETLDRMNDRMIELPAGVSWIRVAENHVDGWEWQRMRSGEEWKANSRAKDGSMWVGPVDGNEESGRMVAMRFRPMSREVGIRVSQASILLLGMLGLVWSRCGKQADEN